MDTNSLEMVVISGTAKAPGGGTLVSILGWLTSDQAIIIGGGIITIAGFIVNLIFQYRRDKREQELLKANLAKIAGA